MSITLGGGGNLIYTPITDNDRFQITGVIRDDSFAICDEKDQLKQIKFNATNMQAGKQLTLVAGSSASDITLTFPTTSGTLGLAGATASFTTIQTDAGTFPVATGPTDTLTLTSGTLDITGNSTTDTVTLNLKGMTSVAVGDAYNILGVNSGGTGFESKALVHASSDKMWVGATQYNACVSIDNPDLTSTYAALVVKHKDGSGNHSNILEIKDQTGITDFISVDYQGQSEFQNLTMRNLYGETVLAITDISTGASVHFGTSYTDPGVPADGFKFFANPFGGSPSWVTSDPYYLNITLVGAGTDAVNATSWAVSDQGNAAGAIYYLLGQYNIQPCISKRLGQSLTAVSTTATQNALCDGIVGGANITGTVTTINGITAPESAYTTSGRNGSRFVIRNKSTNIITMNHLNGSAATADQIRTPNGLPFYLMPEQACELHYDSGSTKWRFIADVSDDGVWTPTLTNTANVSASTAYECKYIAHGKHIYGTGKVDIDPTTTATVTQLRMTLPFTVNNFAAATDVTGGFITTGGVNECGDIIAVVGAQTIEFNWTCVDVTNKTRRFWFMATRV